MDAKDFEKNKLDLIYQKNLQKLNAALAFGSVGTITVIAAYITNPALFRITSIIIAIILAMSLIAYARISRDMDVIISKIDKLK